VAMDRDDDRDIIEISFDDDDEPDGQEQEPATDPDIDIILHDAPRPSSPPSASGDVARRSPRPAAPLPQEQVEPASTEKYCPICGFALRPLDTECPRCARLDTVATPPAAASPDVPTHTDPTYPPVRAPRPPARIGLILVAFIILAIAIAIPFIIINSSAYKARAAYREAVEAQLAGDLETAKAKYLEALEHDPKMGLAAFGLGTAYLGISVGGRADQHIFQLLQHATVGVTSDLEQADRWFDHSIVLANQMPPDRALHDQNINTPRKLASYAHAMKAMTAFIRYYAAILTDDFDIAEQWISVAGREVGQSLTLDPTNPSAQEVEDHIRH
jgi:hypothetical protein